jgi:thioredoxin 1
MTENTTQATSFNDLINGETPVLVDFYADWCAPCKVMAPILKDLKTEMGDRLTIIKIDTDKNRAVATKYQIRGIPTLILFRKGEIIWQQSGVVALKQLSALINQKLQTQ